MIASITEALGSLLASEGNKFSGLARAVRLSASIAGGFGVPIEIKEREFDSGEPCFLFYLFSLLAWLRFLQDGSGFFTSESGVLSTRNSCYAFNVKTALCVGPAVSFSLMSEILVIFGCSILSS